MRKLLLIIATVLVWSTLAFSYENATFNWTPPTEYTDGSPLEPDTDLSEYRIYCDDLAGEADFIVPNSPGVTTYTSPDGSLTVGEHTCAITAVDAASGVESDLSETAVFTVAPRSTKPNAPSGFTVILP